MKKTIYINGRFLTQKITGVQRVALELARAIDNLLDQDASLRDKFAFIIICPESTDAAYSFKHISLVYRGVLKGHLWEQLELPFITRGDLLVNLCNVSPVFKRNQMVMIHDTAVFVYPEAYSFLFRTWYKINYTFASFWSKRILTVSEFSKSELNKYLGIESQKVDVIYPASAFFKEKPCALSKDSIVEKANYVLAVSSLNPQKNLLGVIKAFQQLEDLDIRLKIVGGRNNSVFKSVNFSEDVVERVDFLGYVSDEELVKLYKNALCFIYPSFYEGFGLPPLEAMSCGCPVIVSDRASLPEVCGDAAIYCNPNNITEIASSVRLLYSDNTTKEDFIKMGHEQVKKFSFDLAAVKFIGSVDKCR